VQQNGEIYCNLCRLIIGPGIKHTAFKVPGTAGDKPEHYQHYHNRYVGDCWHEEIRKVDPHVGQSRYNVKLSDRRANEPAHNEGTEI